MKRYLIPFVFMMSVSLYAGGGGGDFPQEQKQQTYQQDVSNRRALPPQTIIHPNAATSLPVIIVKEEEKGFNWLWTTVIIPIGIAYLVVHIQYKKNKRDNNENY